MLVPREVAHLHAAVARAIVSDDRQDKHRERRASKDFSDHRAVSNFDVPPETQHNEVAPCLFGHLDHSTAWVTGAPLE